MLIARIVMHSLYILVHSFFFQHIDNFFDGLGFILHADQEGIFGVGNDQAVYANSCYQSTVAIDDGVLGLNA